MSSCKGDVPSLAVLDTEPGPTALMRTPLDLSAPSPLVRSAFVHIVQPLSSEDLQSELRRFLHSP